MGLKGEVEIFTTEGSITVGRFDFEDASGNEQDRDIEGTTTQIIHRYGLAITLVHSKGQGSSCRLVN